MANTYTQIHIQVVFAVKYREALIDPLWKDRLHRYMTAIVQNHEHKMLAINSMPDHIHLFFGMRTHESIAELMRVVKSDSSEWINKERLTRKPFHWQIGYGAFSYRKRSVDTITRYIANQEKHHAKKNFITEYKELLQEFEIEYDEKYLFTSPE
jgi:REP element-mobilizing transposase RayT